MNLCSAYATDGPIKRKVLSKEMVFAGVSRVEYKPDASLEDSLVYRYYNASERIHGRPMEDWLRPSISFWQAFHSTGSHGQGQGTNCVPFIIAFKRNHFRTQHLFS